jgi:hypothetical protein
MAPSSTPARAILPLLACGLAVALGAGAVLAAGPAGGAAVDGGVQPAIVNGTNSSGYLQPAGASAERRTYVTHGVGVGAAVAADVAALRARHDRLTMRQKLEAAPDRASRLETLQTRLAVLENRTAAIRRAQRRARAAYLDGSASRATLLRRLARLDARAEATERVRNRVEDRLSGSSAGAGETLTETQNLEVALETVGGPATRRVRQRFSGNRSAGVTYVSVLGSHGLVVATVADGRFYRDALDRTARDPTAVSQFSGADEPEISVALRRAARLYPWAFEAGSAAQPLRGYGDTDVYRITAEHPHGSLSAYLDGGTKGVFRELQQRRLEEVPVTETYRATGDGLVLRLNATHETGPLGVTVTRQATGQPVNASLAVDGITIGTTGIDGHRWTVQPRGAATVVARTDDGARVAIDLG